MQLPKEKSKVNKEFKAQRFGMLGVAGIGKSEFWAQDPKALFFESEPGLKALEVFKLPIRSWGDVREAYKLLTEAVKAGEFPYSVIVIDTIDRLIDYATEEVIVKAQEFYKRVEISALGDIPNGMGWFRLKEMVNGFLGKLELMPCAVAYIAHLDVKRIKEVTGEYDKATISIGGQLGDDLLAWTDHTMHIESHRMGDKLQRIVWTIPTQSKEAKSRGGLIPNNWKWTESAKENYEYFRKLFI